MFIWFVYISNIYRSVWDVDPNFLRQFSVIYRKSDYNFAKLKTTWPAKFTGCHGVAREVRLMGEVEQNLKYFTEQGLKRDAREGDSRARSWLSATDSV